MENSALISLLLFINYLYLLALQKVKEILYTRGAKTVRSLGRVFRTLDSFDGNNKVVFNL